MLYRASKKEMLKWLRKSFYVIYSVQLINPREIITTQGIVDFLDVQSNIQYTTCNNFFVITL